MKAYVTWVGDGERWNAHVEHSEQDPTGESSEHETVADAVAWARERTDRVLVVTDPLLWAGAPEKRPPDVPPMWRRQRDRPAGAGTREDVSELAKTLVCRSLDVRPSDRGAGPMSCAHREGFDRRRSAGAWSTKMAVCESPP